MMYVHKDWPRDLIHKESGAHKEFKRPEDVPPGWFTVDGEEVNPETIFVHDGQAGQFVEVKPGAPVDDGMRTPDGPAINPTPAEASDASEQTLRDLRGGGQDPQPRRKGRGKRHPKPDRGNPDVSSDEEAG